MKRVLDVLTDSERNPVAPPQAFRAGGQTLMVFDEGDGSAAKRLASCLAEAGATSLDAGADAEADHRPIRIVIRAGALKAEARKRAAALEAAADVVLGSTRPAFARRLVEALLGER